MYQKNHPLLPSILAPAGNRNSFLAAIAAKADAIYCGLKQFSARMEAPNFTTEELQTLTMLAHSHNIKVYITLNTLIKPNEIDEALKQLDQLNNDVHPDAIIIQDLAFINLAHQVGFSGEVHLSTLANVSFSQALPYIRDSLGVHNIVLPRELSLEEIQTIADKTPPGLGLEVFVHGALCYAISGRCYWSSFLGGKSGLRGRCVQPCRRIYNHQKQTLRFFSCNDLRIDKHCANLLSIPQIKAWKIEGRKKGPSYVFHTVTAYRLLRDHPNEPDIIDIAQTHLDQSLSRQGTCYNFIPKQKQIPIDINSQTGSGLFIGRVDIQKNRESFVSKIPLLSGDKLRLGYEDQPGHAIHHVTDSVESDTPIVLRLASGKKPAKGTPIFLIDRSDPTITKQINVLEKQLSKIRNEKPESDNSNYKSTHNYKLISPNNTPKSSHSKMHLTELFVYRQPVHLNFKGKSGIWLNDLSSIKGLSKSTASNLWWWLPPVIWPNEEASFENILQKVILLGGKNFVLNSPWQVSLFDKKRLNLWAGPFCNISNPLAIDILKHSGFSGVIVSPELNEKDFITLPKYSSLPLGVVIEGHWPLCISRTVSEKINTDISFASPQNETAWITSYDQNFWIFPNWKLNISGMVNTLIKSGYSMLVYLDEPIPKSLSLKNRPGMWNWNLKLL